MGFGLIWEAAKGFLGGISLKTYLIAGAIAVGAIWHFHAVHAARVEGRKEGIAEEHARLQPKLDQANADLADAERGRDEAISANQTNMKTIDALKGSIAQCEAGRIADKAAQAKAMAERTRIATVAQANYAKAKAELDVLQGAGGRCELWARAPACGIFP